MPPPSSDPPVTDLDPADLAACRDALRTGSKTFLAASLVLPRRVRDPATALYAFCRLADDAVDLGTGTGSGDAVALLRDRLERAAAGCPAPDPADRALAAVLRAFAIPKTLPLALIDGLEWDAAGRTYDDLAGLRAYATRVAGTVGAMMALIMGERRPEVVARAIDLGIAMQLTNIARDVGEDARAGRLYLPRAWLREAGLDPDAWLRAPRFEPRLAAVVARLLRVADELYARAGGGIGALPASCRPGIHAARVLYAEIGREVARRGHDSVADRAVVGGRRKLALLPVALGASLITDDLLAAPVVPEASFLVEAVRAGPLPPAPPADAATGIAGRAIWVIDLFARLERQEQLRRA